MRRSAVTMPLIALIAGVFGFLVRRRELSTVFDGETGLPVLYEPVTLLLIGLSVTVFVLAVIAGLVISARRKADREYVRAFTPGSFFYVVASFLLGLAWLAAVVLHILDLSALGIFTIIDWVFLLLAALSAVAVVVLALGAFTRRQGTGMIAFSVMPSLFFCFWLILLYKDNATNPVLLDYCYQSLAIAGAALSFYFSAGFAFKKAATGWTIFSCLITVFFSVVALADEAAVAIRIIFAAVALISALNLSVFLRNLKSKTT